MYKIKGFKVIGNAKYAEISIEEDVIADVNVTTLRILWKKMGMKKEVIGQLPPAKAGGLLRK